MNQPKTLEEIAEILEQLHKAGYVQKCEINGQDCWLPTKDGLLRAAEFKLSKVDKKSNKVKDPLMLLIRMIVIGC